MLNKPNGGITCGFHARDLHLVVGLTAPGMRVRFRADRRKAAKRCPRTGRCEQGYGRIGQRLYQLIRQTKPVVDRKLEIESYGPGAGMLLRLTR
jgi:thioredoxin family protein